MNEKFGLRDPRYSNSYKNLMASFCIRTFNRIIPLVLEVLDNMQKTYEINEDGYSITHGAVDFMRSINQIVNAYKHCEHHDSLLAILGLIYK